MEKTRILQIYHWMTVGTDLKTPNPPLLLCPGWEHFFPRVSVALQKQLYHYLLVDPLAISEDFARGSSPDEKPAQLNDRQSDQAKSLRDIISDKNELCLVLQGEMHLWKFWGDFARWLCEFTQYRAQSLREDPGWWWVAFFFFFFVGWLACCLLACLFIYLF